MSLRRSALPAAACRVRHAAPRPRQRPSPPGARRGGSVAGCGPARRCHSRASAGRAVWWQPRRGAPRGGGRREPFPAAVFEQVHPAMGDRVRDWALRRWARSGRVGWDLYAGIGETTALLARRGAGSRASSPTPGPCGSPSREAGGAQTSSRMRAGSRTSSARCRRPTSWSPIRRAPAWTRGSSRPSSRRPPGAWCTSAATRPRSPGTCSRSVQGSRAVGPPGLRPVSADGARRDRRDPGAAHEVLRDSRRPGDRGRASTASRVDGEPVSAALRAAPRHAPPTAP